NREQIHEGMELVDRAMVGDTVGVYTLQAAISATHAEAPSTEETDWDRIVGLYDLLLTGDPSPVVELNRAVAVAMREGPEAGLVLVEEILDRGELAEYRLAHAARADLCRRLGRADEAISAYEKAIALTKQGPEHRFLQKRLEELS
ncbi:MAG: tetratricopeptide repeat protein, partial [Candidatus Omnitrophica bacterium]|nr:tetratricopeptide repeat protein [Candidatus Omnitrophota bacterium]